MLPCGMIGLVGRPGVIDGCDGGIIKNHRNIRQASRRLNWYQLAERERAFMNALAHEPGLYVCVCVCACA